MGGVGVDVTSGVGGTGGTGDAGNAGGNCRGCDFAGSVVQRLV